MNTKKLFDLVPNWVYLDNAASTPSFVKVKESVVDFLNSYGSVHRGDSYMSKTSTDRYEQARENIKKILKAPTTHDLVFCQNTTDGLNKLSLMVDLSNKTIAVSDIEHSANYLPWAKRAKKVVQIKTNENFRIDLEDLEKTLKTENIYLLSLALASNVSGVVLSSKELDFIYKLTRETNTLLVLDAAQAVAHMKVDLSKIKCDAIVFAGHKMYAPYGGGAIIARKDYLDNTFNSLTGGGNVEDINYQTGEVLYKEVPYRHEIGTPNAIGSIALEKAFEVLYKDIGIEEVENHNQEVIQAFKELKEFDILKDRNVNKKTPILLIKKDEKILKLLREHNIAFREGNFCVYNFMRKIGEPKGVIRLSAGLTTSVEDIKVLEKILKGEK